MGEQSNRQSLPRKVAQWNEYTSNIFLEEVKKEKNSLRRGDNGLRQEQWLKLCKVMREQCSMDLDILQVKNHYKVWRLRFRGLMVLRNLSGMGFENNRFTCSKETWDSLAKTNKEIKYWIKHDITETHEELLRWLIDDIATGSFTGYMSQNNIASKFPSQNEIIDEDTLNETMLDDETNFMPPFIDTPSQSPIPSSMGSPSASPIHSSSTIPSFVGGSGKGKKRKDTSTKEDFIREMANISSQMNSVLNTINASTKLHEVLQTVRDDIGEALFLKAVSYFLDKPKAILSILNFPKEDLVRWIKNQFSD